jgi:NSS family neurotransmitter:Na+ symporter
MSANREQFGSRLGFILAAAGSAVGIGNLVGFPVNAAKNGGGAFLLIYAICIVLLCLPVMLAELSLGRATRKDPLGAYQSIAGKTMWRFAGWLSLITPFMIAVFYTVITVWLLAYVVNTLMGNLDTLAAPGTFGEFVKSNSIFGYFVAVAAIVFFILSSGVKDGIEKAAKILMPALFLFLIGLVVFVLTLDNAWAGVSYYMVPDFNKINGAVISSALSQAFFSLSLGMGILITYGSYMDKKEDLPGAAKMVALCDTGVAFAAGLLILPAVFSFDPNVNPEKLSDSSVSLIFTFLPKIFLALQATLGYAGASFVAALFFTLVFFAAITSLVSIIEVPTASLIDEKCYSRKKALSVLGVSMGVLAIASALSFGKVGFLTDFVNYAGSSRSLFDLIIDTFYDTILPLNGLLVCLFVIYRWKKASFNAEIEEGNPNFKGTWLERYVNFSVGTFIPVILFLIFINTVAMKYFGFALISL